MNLQTLRLYRIAYGHSLMILVDSDMVSSYDFVRCSETAHLLGSFNGPEPGGTESMIKK